MPFEFATANRIIFGAGTLTESGKIAADWGKRALVVTGGNAARADRLGSILKSAGISYDLFPTPYEPTVELVTRGRDQCRAQRAEMVIGLGGGSAIDAAKAIAGLATQDGDALDYLEVVGRGLALSKPALPWMAIPTTAGTGAEVTRNAVLSVPDAQVKASLRSPFLLARVALVDPELTLDLPKPVTAMSGLDALTQLIESYVSLRATPFTDALCVAALPKVARALPLAWRDAKNLAARTDVAFGSLTSGIALANSGLGTIHGFAAALGGMFPAPHGGICAALLAPVTEMNLQALRARGASASALKRYQEAAQFVTGDSAAKADDILPWVRGLVAEFQIPKLSAWGVRDDDAAEIVSRVERASSTKGNPIALTTDELHQALRAAL